MPIYDAIATVLRNPPVSEIDAFGLLNTYPANVQRQLISATVLGREFLRSGEVRPARRSVTNVQHLNDNEFPKVLWEKSVEEGPSVVAECLRAALRFAREANFDLNKL